MFNRLSKYRSYLLMLIDSICIVSGYCLALFLRFDLHIFETVESEYWTILWKSMWLIVLINCIFLFIFKVHKSLWRYFSINEIFRVCASIVLANGMWFLVISTRIIPNWPRSIPVIAVFVIIMEMLAVRSLYRLYRRQVKVTKNLDKILICGAGDAGVVLAREIIETERYDLTVAGFIDISQSKQGKFIMGLPVLGTDDDIKRIVAEKGISAVYIAIPSATKKQLRHIVSIIKGAGVTAKIMNYQEQSLDKKVQLRDVSIEDLLGRGEIHLDDSQIGGYLTNKVVMVTGAGGSIGSELCRQLVKFHPSKLVMLDIYENNLYGVQQEFNILKRKGEIKEETELVYLIGSIRDKKRLDEIMEEYNPSVVYHAAAHKHVPLMEDSPREAIKNNVFGTLNLVKSCIEHKVERYIQISTDKAVNPTNVMGATKRMCELIVQAYGNNGVTKMSAVRFGNVLGSNGSVIPLFREQIKNGGPVTVTHKDIIRYFMTIPEAAQLVLQAGAYADDGQIYVLDMGEPVKILKLAEDMISLSGLKPYEDIKIEFTGLRPGEKMYEELNLDESLFTRTENKLIFKERPGTITVDELNSKLNNLGSIIIQGNNIEIKDVNE
ncbi:MAG: polysaccharide biosynthesis protein [Erysipelotrichales bacterium]|nr:polysaccharide biosynthesis protein [Erysipelotrichales bacterium]